MTSQRVLWSHFIVAVGALFEWSRNRLRGNEPGTCQYVAVHCSPEGAGAFGNDGNVSVYEFAHPLSSGDVRYDVDLALGQSILIQAVVSIRETLNGVPYVTRSPNTASGVTMTIKP